MTTMAQPTEDRTALPNTDYDAVIVGAGFSGFDETLQQDWDWSERYAAQPELLRYAQHVAERFDLPEHITFDTRVDALQWDEDARLWTISTDDGQQTTARFVVLGTGCLSVPQEPTFEGMEDFDGEIYYTSRWPHAGVDLAGKKVAVIGTGSSGLQTITAIAPEVESLTVFQRTPNFAIPAHNHPLTDVDRQRIKDDYPQIRAANFASALGFYADDRTTLFTDADDDQVRDELDKRWEKGGLGYTRSFADVLQNPSANEALSEFARQKIRERVQDQELAEKLLPYGYPVGAKRMCVDTGYFEVYNQENVHLVDINAQPIERFTSTGIRAGSEDFDVDVIVLATGFDAMTGAITGIDISAEGRSLKTKWEHGPRTYLGLMSAGFPNLFTVTGPQSPSVLTNMMTSIEYHVDFISRLLDTMRSEGRTRVEARPEAEDNWVNINNDLGALTLMPQANSWYMGSNIPGKERTLLPFVGGSHAYIGYCEGVVVGNYHGFKFT